MGGLRGAVTLTVAAVCAGCSLLVNTDDLAGGLTLGDGGADSADDALDDAPLDAPGDAGADGSLEAQSDAPLDGPKGCTGAHAFCDDFDDGGLGAGWTSTRTTNGTLALDPAVSRSPSRSFVVTANPLDASGTSYKVALLKTFSGNFSSIHCEFDVLTSSEKPPQTASAFGLYVLGNAGPDFFVLWDIDQARLYQELSPNIKTMPITIPTAGRWTRIAFELKLAADAGPGTFTLWYDGAQITSLPTLGQPNPVSAVRFDLGLALGYAPLNNTWHINYDNAWCDVL